MKNLPRIKIKTDGIHAEIFIDGVKVDCLAGYTVKHEAGKIPELILKINGADVELDGRMLPALPEAFRPFYAAIKEPCEDGSELES